MAAAAAEHRAQQRQRQRQRIFYSVAWVRMRAQQRRKLTNEAGKWRKNLIFIFCCRFLGAAAATAVAATAAAEMDGYEVR